MEPAIILHLGDEQFTLHPCVPWAQKVIQCLLDSSFDIFLSHCDAPDIRGNYLAITDSLKLNQLAYPNGLSSKEHSIWVDFYNDLITSHQARMISIDDGGVQGKTFIFGDSFKSANSSNLFDQAPQPQINVIYIDNQEESPYLRFMVCALFISARLHVVSGGLCLHSAAVSRKGKGFLFLGESGSGKSTATKMSESVGCLALGDDLNFVLRKSNGEYQLAMAWPYSEGDSTLRPPLSGVFKLVQDNRDYLVRLSLKQSATELFEVFTKQTSYTPRLSNDIFRLGFHTICNIARCIPMYELHFRKTPDFWKLIDAEFPD